MNDGDPKSRQAPPMISPADFEWIFQAIPIPCVLLRPDLVVVAVNDAYLAATRTSALDLLGQSLTQAFPAHPVQAPPGLALDLNTSLFQVLDRAEPNVVPVQGYDIGSGADPRDPYQRRYWQLINAPLVDDQGEVNFILHWLQDFTDILQSRSDLTAESATPAALQERILRLEKDMHLRQQQRLELESAVRKARESQQQVERAKDCFFSNLSHELRTPLALILGPAEDLLQADPPIPDWEWVEVETIHRSAEHLRKTINMLLDFSQTQAGLADATYEPVDLSAYTCELASLFRSAVEGAGLSFLVSCPPLPEMVYVDRSQWESIVLNLLSNAFKFTLTGKIEVTLRHGEHGPELSIRDTGCGIPAKDQPFLFERLHRIEPIRARTTEGAGIGLALVRELVHLHGGNIRVESTPGQGSIFHVRIPYGTAHLPPGRIATAPTPQPHSNSRSFIDEAISWLPGPAPELQLEEEAGSGARPRVLLAEDNTDMRGYMTRLLGRIYDVESVADGLAALEAIQQRPPDLLLTDAIMLGISGVDLVRRLRGDARTAALPIIVLSADSSEDARIAGFQAGANDYLLKPFSNRELLARVSGLLAQGELIRREQQLRTAVEGDRQWLEIILESIHDSLLVIDRHWRIDLLNSRAAGEQGQPRDSMLGKDFRHYADAPVIEAVQQVMERRQPVSCEYHMRSSGRWWDLRLSPSPGGGVVVFSAEITQRKLSEKEQLHVAQHDGLTNLSNRKLFLEDAERVLAWARRLGHKFAVLFIDLDNFKPINDSHGHEIGDKLLRAVADRISRTLRAEDLVGRYGGDEFVGILVGIEAVDNVARVAENILTAISQPYQIDGFDLQVTASIGVSLYPKDGDEIDTLIQYADYAMYAAKASGAAHYEFYREGIEKRTATPAVNHMVTRLREALEAGEFSLVFQPVFATDTAEVVEAEAMLRWRQPDGSYVAPESFLPLAELTGLIRPLGEWLIRTACSQQQQWLNEGLPTISIAVKISGAQFRQKDFEQKVADVLRDTGMDPARLLLEMAEHTVLGNTDESVRVLQELKNMGVGVAINNFGAGNSNIRALTRCPVDKLKVDRSLLQHQGDNGAHLAAMEAVIGLGHSLRKAIVAEGIENEADMAYVRGRGCQYSQGYLLAPPMPPEEFSRWWFEQQSPLPPSTLIH